MLTGAGLREKGMGKDRCACGQKVQVGMLDARSSGGGVSGLIGNTDSSNADPGDASGNTPRVGRWMDERCFSSKVKDGRQQSADG